YMNVLLEHGLARSDMPVGDMIWQMGAMTIGFFVSGDYLAAFGWNPEFERRADLLEDAIRRCYATPATEEALAAACPRVIELFEKSRDLMVTYLRRAYAAPHAETGEES
ncbi:MAG TPA: hypothetical protein VFI08_06880, partial [Spirochaetia bacterium]|nr:hypothetical protein [Spirochaetia bacterium]